jgi:phosphohistidine phosphatase
MNLYLIRHGDAEKAAADKKDSERELTKKGRDSVIKAVTAWKNFLSSFDFIVSSPYTRAQQTAKIISDTIQYPNEIITENNLRNGGDLNEVINLINTLGGEEIAVVGHQPDISDHLAALISESTANIDFKKGSIAKVAFEGKVKLGRGTLEFLIPADIFK